MGPLISLFCFAGNVWPDFKARVEPSLACVQQFLKFHLLCNTWWPLDGLHGGWAILIHLLAHVQALIRRGSELKCSLASKSVTRQTLYQLSFDDYVFLLVAHYHTITINIYLLPSANEVCEGYVFTCVCHSVHGGMSVPGGVSAPGGCLQAHTRVVSQHALRQAPPTATALYWNAYLL